LRDYIPKAITTRGRDKIKNLRLIIPESGDPLAEK